jgi:hypothetical protein
MLWIVPEFDHIQIIVGSQHEVALGSTPHASNLLGCDYSHRPSPCAL